MERTSSVQLQELPRQGTPSIDNEENAHTVSHTALPFTDHGRDAYLVLAACAVVQAPVWGYPLAFGIFQEFYTANAAAVGLGDATPGAIASIGTTQNGLMYLLMPFLSTTLIRYPFLRRWSGPAGLVVTLASLIGSAYATTVAELIATQGVLYALGCGLLFSPTSLYLDEWFVKRKGLAYGIMWSAKSIVGVITPFLSSALLDRFGLRTTLLAWAAASAVLTMPLITVMKPRVPLPSRISARPPPVSFAFLRHPLFWMLQIGNILQSFGYLMPTTYLASYATSIGLSHVAGPVLLAVFSLSSVPGSLVHGMLGDRLAATTVILISSAGSAAAVLLLWGFSLHAGALFAFVILYGFFAGGFSATWSGILQEMKRAGAGPAGDPASQVDTGLVFGMLMGGRGLGFVLSGPVSGALLSSAAGGSVGAGGTDISAYSSQYGPMIICTGTTAVLGAWGWIWTTGKQCRRTLRRRLAW